MARKYHLKYQIWEIGIDLLIWHVKNSELHLDYIWKNSAMIDSDGPLGARIEEWQVQYIHQSWLHNAREYHEGVA